MSGQVGMGFYERAMDAAEQLDFAAARELEGVKDEIAVARTVALRLFAAGDAADPEVLLEAVELVGKLQAIAFRISGKPTGDLSESLAAVVRSVSELMPAAAGA